MGIKLNHRIALGASCIVSISLVAGDWPQWRGSNRDGRSSDAGLHKTWPSDGPKQIWLFKNAGAGYGGPAVVNDRLYLMGTRDRSALLFCLNANTGDEVWSTEMGPLYSNGWGDGPRGTPTVDGDRVYAMSGRGDLICARTTNGDVLWKISMRELGGSTPNWGYTESVLIDGHLLICTPGGSKGAIAALDKFNGNPIWRSTEFTEGAQYSSPIVAVINGVRQYIQRTTNDLAGVAAVDGSLLWQTDVTGRTAVVPTPIVAGNLVYTAAGYGAGSKLVQIGPNNKVSEIYDNKTMKNHHGGVVRVGDFLYGYSDGVGWVCQNFATGKRIWRERKKLGKGSLAYADGMLYCLDEDDGTVALIECNSDRWKEVGRFKLTPQSNIRSSSGGVWTHPVIANSKLFLRDQNLVYCYDISAESPKG